MRICEHLRFNSEDADHYQWFSGRGIEYSLICSCCVKLVETSEVNFVDVNSEEFAMVEKNGSSGKRMSDALEFS
jgi:hypothetical protein